MTIPPRSRERLTGRARCRLQWLTGKAILQLEVQKQYTYAWPGCPPPPDCTNREAWASDVAAEFERSWRTTQTFFRDAKPSEVLAPNLFGIES